ncbi:3-oxoacyl-[acyl-carrier-protein] reductase [Pollutimonas nitritireducens]|uniref:3-oxoacyl-[acyl-carrier-protein] reductase n=1 Tax=Pollutimonas nitritireducens TaxID=2045209 RepID=A0A2N4UKQ1_9BURK|nr:SDR family NAD(P)-dependent oxidoreductase [Pollutimonas nitritireducens]PLC55593.1 3-oxoacyl-[acyl-carrier-protein] reductase [Pollutimonas nitritireducens]
MRFNNKVALVTGALGGIGSAIVGALLAEGARVGLVDVNAEAGKRFDKELSAAGHQVTYVNANVSSFAECEAAFTAIKAQLGEVDILVNNVGISPKRDGRALKVWEMPPEEWDTVVSVNLSSMFYMTRLATPDMIKKREGRIINMSSVAGKAYCDIVAAHYAATKAALIGATRHWAGELGEYNVTVNALAPGRISTPLLKMVPQETNDAVAQVTALKRLGTPEEVADACVFFASDQARFVTGQTLDVAGGWLMT